MIMTKRLPPVNTEYKFKIYIKCDSLPLEGFNTGSSGRPATSSSSSSFAIFKHSLLAA